MLQSTVRQRVHPGGVESDEAIVMLTYIVTAGDDTLDIQLIGDGSFGDNNPILNGYTVEDLGVPAAEALRLLAPPPETT